MPSCPPQRPSSQTALTSQPNFYSLSPAVQSTLRPNSANPVSVRSKLLPLPFFRYASGVTKSTLFNLVCTRVCVRVCVVTSFRMLVNHGPSQQSSKKNTSHGNEMLPQNTTYLIQRPCYQRGSPYQDPAGNWTTRRPPNHCEETQTAVVGSCFPFIRSGQNHLARHSERGKKTRQTEEEVGRQHQGMDRPGGRQVPEGSGDQGKKWRKLVLNHLWYPTTLVAKGQMMMMMMMMMSLQ